ncbi:transporter substrate-binding domain-containing protein [Desulfosporosinus fructosivorans]|uniref:Transporter substrate-binding domain-containing protein n=1 Tax=Desulfosporosinus fructosivorans TaxID=2018669 RepID=A0A4Z0RAQ3_9FIRM|nr:HD domain-containing phosphohydrolase [Desulfosporosinus fructosivorans]TGE39093.1 transporter substrate-binding domain-containing protein [Desulfosporosinus fructosivorans]
MRNNRNKHFLILVIGLLLFLLNTTYVGAAEDTKAINVVLDDNYPPYSFRDDHGILQGITIDQWKLFEKKTGIQVRINGMDWNKAYLSMISGEYDVIDTISYNKDRATILEFTDSYANIDVPIFSHRNISGISNVSSLSGFTVGVKKGDNSIQFLKENGVKNIVEYDTAEEVVQAAKDQNIVIFTLGKPPALYYMYKMQIQDEFNYSSSLYTSTLHRAVKKGNFELVSTINSGFAKISTDEYKSINKKWFGISSPSFYEAEIFRSAISISIIILLVILVLFSWNRTLKRKVEQKTRELDNLIKDLKISESTFRTLFEGSSDGILLMECNQIIDCNPAALDLLDYDSKNSIIGKSPWDFSPKNQSNGKNSKEETLEIIKTAQKEGKLKYEWWLQKSDDRIITVEVMMTSILLNGKKTYHSLLRDISDRKHMEQKLQFLSYHDQLTGLYNRRFFEEELKRLDVKRNLPLTIVMADVNGLKLVNDSFGHAIGDELLKKVAKVMTQGCRADEIIARLGGDEFVFLLPNTDAYETEQIIKRIKALALREKVGSIDLSVSFGYETKRNEEEIMREILKKAEELMYKTKLHESPSIRGKTISAIISTLHENNKREEQHSYRVSALCEKMGRALGLPESKVEELKTVGLLHDIGKIAIDVNILNKPGKLTIDEWEQITRHPEIGYRILSTVKDMSEMAEYVLAHHEKWDGSGYPKRLKAKEIPLQSRIIAIADAYDAMTSERSYRSPLLKETAINQLENSAGIQFDPELVKVFISIIP